METKWLVDFFCLSAEQVEIVAETAKFVTVRRRHGRGREFDQRMKKDERVFASFEEAKTALLIRAQRRVAVADQELRVANSQLEKTNALQVPSSE